MNLDLFTQRTRVMLATPADFAALAVASRDGEKLLDEARRFANAILDVQGSVAVWEVRIAMAQRGRLANNGKEKLDAFGGLCTGMQLVAVDSERPPEWAQALLLASHANKNTVWARPQDVAQYSSIERKRRAHSAPARRSA